MKSRLAYIGVFIFLVGLIGNFSGVYAADGDEKSWAVQTSDDFAECLDSTYKLSRDQAVVDSICGQAWLGYYAPTVMVHGANCYLGGGWPNNFGGKCSNDPVRAQVMRDASLLSSTQSLVASVYSAPTAHTSSYIADLGSKLGVVQPAYAQGIGFSALEPILKLWKMSRNIAYGLIIVMLLVVGVMIMMRSKIDARTVISIQSALPRIIAALILITFSYPIAGFMIDLMYVILFFGLGQIAGSNGIPGYDNALQLQAHYAGGGGAGLFGSFFGIVEWTTWVGTGLSIAVGIFSIFAMPAMAGLLTKAVGAGLATALSSSVKLAVPLGSIGIGIGLMGLFLAVTMLFAYLRIYFMLLQSYISLLINIIFAPILLLGEVLPGQNQLQFGSWIRNIAANLIVFPATAILIVLAGIIVREFSQPGADLSLGDSIQVIWSPPLLGIGANQAAEILIPLGFALAIPQLVGAIKKAFGARSVLSVGGAVGQAFSQPIGVVQQGLSTMTQIRMLRHY